MAIEPTKSNPESDEQDSSVDSPVITEDSASAEKPTEIAADAATPPAQEPASAAKEEHEKEKEKPALDVQAEFTSLEQQIQTLSHNQSVALVTFENNLNRARKFIADGDKKLASVADSLREKLQEILARNQTHQESLLEQSKEFISKLEKALEEGLSNEALSTWDNIQGNVNNTTGEIKKSLQPLLVPFKSKIAELRDRKIIAATEKKKELVEQMKSLSDSSMNPGDKSRQISKMHRDWKALGRSNQNEELWLEFKQASDKASEACKEYFKQRKQQMAANLQARQTLCNELEQEFKAIKDGSPTLSQLNKLLKQADDTWKKHAPVDHNKIKTLQKRYYDVVNELRKMRKTLVRNSAQVKKELIARAAALLEGDDTKLAMSEAKKLQQEWKQAGPGAYKDDKQLWEKFRGLCDQIFSFRDKEKADRRSRLDDAQKQLQPLLKELEVLAAVVDDQLREKRKHYQHLQQSFSGFLDQIPGKQRGKFRDQFNTIKRKLDTRYQALPDKKSQALLDGVRACAIYLQEFENNAPGKQTGEPNKTAEAFDQDHWQSLLAEISAERRSRLQERADFLFKPEQQKDTAEAARQAFRQLCISAEIRANMESPEEDQARRMELQLSQLQTGFGQGKHQQNKTGEFAVNCRLDALCLGPLQEEERKQFQERLDKSLQRLF